MRPANTDARERLTALLARRAGWSATELSAQLGVSVPTVHRMLKECAGQWVAGGKGKRTRYAMLRPVRGLAARLPLYEVAESGQAELMGELAPIRPEGSFAELHRGGWPIPEESVDGWWGGLPYPVFDMRPQGFMGRQFARAWHRDLGLAADPREWSDDDVIHALCRRGSDTVGNLIVGDAAYEAWVQSKLDGEPPLRARGLGPAYDAMARQAVAAGVAQSSAGGEFPKFVARRELPGSATPHVLVKFSGADDSTAVRRWADLLVCEHLALEAAAGLPGVAAARSRIVAHGGRTFLEVERFDRHGEWGRSRLVSLETINGFFLGQGTSDWVQLARGLVGLGLLDDGALEAIELVWWFGRLIGNVDMHLGNLSFRPAGMLHLAPVYDMVPMLYAPLPGGEVPEREFRPAVPRPQERERWMQACVAAVDFWQRAASDARISEGFRKQVRRHADTLRAAAEAV